MVAGEHRTLEAIGVHEEAGAGVHQVLAVIVGVHLHSGTSLNEGSDVDYKEHSKTLIGGNGISVLV